MAKISKIETDKTKLILDAKNTIECVLEFEPEEIICVYIKNGKVYCKTSNTNNFLVQIGALEYAKNKLFSSLD